MLDTPPFHCQEWRAGQRYDEQSVVLYQLECEPTSVTWVHCFHVLREAKKTGLQLVRVALESEEEQVEAFLAGHSGDIPNTPEHSFSPNLTSSSLWEAAISALSSDGSRVIYVAPSVYFESHYGQIRAMVNTLSIIEAAAFVLMDTFGDDPLLMTDYKDFTAPYQPLSSGSPIKVMRPLVDRQAEFLSLRRELLFDKQEKNRGILRSLG
jgi:hypothetical protein